MENGSLRTEVMENGVSADGSGLIGSASSMNKLRNRKNYIHQISVLSGASAHSHQPGGTPLPPLTNRKKLIAVNIGIVYFCAYTTFSVISPFFPSEAIRKGATESQVGFIFGAYNLVMFLICPLYGKWMPHIGSKFLMVAGIAVAGFSQICFGFLNHAPDGRVFVAMCFVARTVEGFGAAAYMTASMAIIGREFPARASTMYGAMETFSGIGLASGPLVGGFFYDIGGFVLPFLFLGTVMLLCAVLTFFILPQCDDEEVPQTGSVIGLLRIPAVAVATVTVVISGGCYGFHDPTLETHLRQFNPTSLETGLLFLCINGVYLLGAPISGWLADAKVSPKRLMLAGSLITAAGFTLLGPAFFLPLDFTPPLAILALVTYGVGMSLTIVPPFSDFFKSALENGLPDDMETAGLCSGLFMSSYAFGAFIGPTMGGVLVEAFTYSMATTLLAIVNVALALTIFIFLVHDAHKRRLGRVCKLSLKSLRQQEEKENLEHDSLILTPSPSPSTESSGESTSYGTNYSSMYDR